MNYNYQFYNLLNSNKNYSHNLCHEYALILTDLCLDIEDVLDPSIASKIFSNPL